MFGVSESKVEHIVDKSMREHEERTGKKLDDILGILHGADGHNGLQSRMVRIESQLGLVKWLFGISLPVVVTIGIAVYHMAQGTVM